MAYFSITEPVITKNAIENVDQTEGEDLWVGSTEASVVESAKKHFLSDWKNAIPSVQKIQEIEEGRMPDKTRILHNEDEIIRLHYQRTNTPKHYCQQSIYLFGIWRNANEPHVSF